MALILLLAALLTQQCLADVPARRFLAFGGHEYERLVYVYSADQENPLCQLPYLPQSANLKPHASRIGENITVCGGGMDSCVTLIEREGDYIWMQSMGLDVTLAPAIASPDNSIWTFFGGRLNEKSITVWTQGQDEFEKVNVDLELGENLCAVRRNDSHAIISAGREDVYWYQEDGQIFQKWDTEGRSVIDTLCGMVKSEEHGELFVSAGGRLVDNRSMRLTTVEIFNFELNMWIKGPNLPYPVAGAAALNIDDTFGFIGGLNPQKPFYFKEALQFNFEEGWLELPVKLKNPDSRLGTLLLEEGEVPC